MKVDAEVLKGNKKEKEINVKEVKDIIKHFKKRKDSGAHGHQEWILRQEFNFPKYKKGKSRRE